MAEAQVQTRDETLIDPIAQGEEFHQTESMVAIFGHPIHAATVTFPAALTFCAFGADALCWWTGDVF